MARRRQRQEMVLRRSSYVYKRRFILAEPLRVLLLSSLVLGLYQLRARPLVTPGPLSANGVGAAGGRDEDGEATRQDRASAVTPCQGVLWRDGDGDDGRCGVVAQALLEPLGRAVAKGVVAFAYDDDELVVLARVQGAPAGAHALSVHAERSCPEPPPSGRPWPLLSPLSHGSAYDVGGRLGDLGDVVAGEDGQGLLEVHLGDTSGADSVRAQGWWQVVGRVVVLYELGGHFSARQEGSAGAPIACGVVRFQEPPPSL